MQPVNRTKILGALIALALGLSAPLAEANTSYTGTVHLIHSPDTRPCFFFTLDGVPVADSAISSSEWYGVAQSAANYKEIVALVLFARANGMPLTANTSGGGSCGFADVGSVTL